MGAKINHELIRAGSYRPDPISPRINRDVFQPMRGNNSLDIFTPATEIIDLVQGENLAPPVENLLLLAVNQAQVETIVTPIEDVANMGDFSPPAQNLLPLSEESLLA